MASVVGLRSFAKPYIASKRDEFKMISDVRDTHENTSEFLVRALWREKFLGKIFFENGQFGGVIFGEKFFEKYFA